MKYLVLLSLIFLLSCDKKESIITPPPPEEETLPRIATWQDTIFTAVRHNVFTYNEHGNPLSVTSEHAGTGAEPDFFTYDTLQRLIQHSRLFTYRYLYDGTDSLPYAAIEEWPYGQKYSLAYTYDQEQRIVKVVSDHISSSEPSVDTALFPNHSEFVFAYNSDGNLVNGQDYTDKPSIYRTNKWWQLVHLNFSKNDVKSNSDYNQWDLPGKVNSASFLALGAGLVGYAE
jgi:hypothetical protein